MKSCGPLLLGLAAVSLASGAAAENRQGGSTAPSVAYVVTVAQPHTHVFQVEMDVSGIDAATIDVSMPVWTPGSYLVREYERHVIRFEAASESGSSLAWHKVDKNTWRIETGGASHATVRYEVYAREPGIRWSFLYADGGHILGPNLFMYVVGAVDQRTAARFDLPAGWRLDGGLEPAREDPFMVSASSYHELIDTPMLIGHFSSTTVQVEGIPHVIMILGPHGADLGQLGEDFERIIAVCSAMFGGLPYERYALVFITLTSGGGIEHANGTTIGVGLNMLSSPRTQSRVLGTVSHEYFHAWNVKRIQPPAFRPYDYEEENYTDALWFYEGFTSYYGDRILYRAGLTGSLGSPAAIASNWESIPGNRNQSPADASFNAWIHLYRSDESSDNYRSNYYFTGSVIANLLELEIADRTAGAKGLDDLMRYIWEQTRDRGAEFDSEAIRAACEAVAGGSFREFFDRYVFGTEAIPFAEYFRLAGYDLVVDTAATQAQNQRGFLGVSSSESGDGLQIVGVVRGSPAWHAGINYGDIIVSVGGTRVTGSQSFTQALAPHRPGETVTVVVSRYGQTQSFDVTLAERPVPVYRLEETAQPTEKQLSVRRLWRMEG